LIEDKKKLQISKKLNTFTKIVQCQELTPLSQTAPFIIQDLICTHQRVDPNQSLGEYLIYRYAHDDGQ